MIEVNIINAVTIQKQISEEVKFLEKMIDETPDGLGLELQGLLDKRKAELVSIDTGISKATLLVPQTTARFMDSSKIIVEAPIKEL